MSDALPEDYIGGWEAHADEQRRHVLQSTPAQRLQWLEQALAWVHAVRGAPRAEDHDS